MDIKRSDLLQCTSLFPSVDVARMGRDCIGQKHFASSFNLGTTTGGLIHGGLRFRGEGAMHRCRIGGQRVIGNRGLEGVKGLRWLP